MLLGHVNSDETSNITFVETPPMCPALFDGHQSTVHNVDVVSPFCIKLVLNDSLDFPVFFHLAI